MRKDQRSNTVEYWSGLECFTGFSVLTTDVSLVSISEIRELVLRGLKWSEVTRNRVGSELHPGQSLSSCSLLTRVSQECIMGHLH